MTTPTVRDALSLRRLSRIKERSARMQVIARAEAGGEPRESAISSLLVLLGAEAEPEPASHFEPNKAH